MRGAVADSQKIKQTLGCILLIERILDKIQAGEIFKTEEQRMEEP